VMGKATAVAKFVELCSSSTESLKAGEHLKAIEDVSTAQLGFKDVQMFMFKPKCNVLLNVVGLLYCIHRLGVPVFTSWPSILLLICLFSDMQTSGSVKKTKGI
jgi:hypothetical protein